MKRRFGFGKFMLVALAIGLTSCGGFNKLRRSTNPELKYNKAIEYYNKGRYNRSLILFQDIFYTLGSSTKGDTIAYYLGASMYKEGDFETSGEIFDEFRRFHLRSPFVEDVEYMYAKGIYFTSPRPERDQTNTIRAISAISEFLNRYPESNRRPAFEANTKELYRKLYDKTLLSSRLYYDIGYYNSAVTALKNALNLYPESPHHELLSYLVVRSHYMYARNSVQEKQRQRYLDMQDAYYSFMSEYPESRYKRDVEKMQNDAKKYLARYEIPDDGSEPVIADPELSDRELRKMQKEEQRTIKAEDKKLREIDNEIRKTQNKRVKKPVSEQQAEKPPKAKKKDKTQDGNQENQHPQ